MFYYSQKSFLLFAFLGLAPLSIYAMEENKNSYFSKFLNYSFRRESAEQVNAKLKNILEIALNGNGKLQDADAAEIQKLLACGANSNIEIDFLLSSKKFTKMTPLYAILYASKSLLKNQKLNDVEMGIAKNLLENKANPNIKKDGITPLSYAIYCNASQTVDLLLQYDAKVDVKNFGETPLECAIKEGNGDIIKKLCVAGVPLVDADNRTFFHYMARNKIAKKRIETSIISVRPTCQQKITDIDILAGQITWLKEILQKNSANEGTVLQILTNLPANQKNKEYVENVWALFDGSQLDQDYAAIKKNPNLLNPEYLAQNPKKAEEAKKNLAWKMLDFNSQD